VDKHSRIHKILRPIQLKSTAPRIGVTRRALLLRCASVALPGQTFVLPSSTIALSRGFCQDLFRSRTLIDPRQQWSRGPRPLSGAVGRVPATEGNGVP
jgi:hypothetical protein